MRGPPSTENEIVVFGDGMPDMVVGVRGSGHCWRCCPRSLVMALEDCHVSDASIIVPVKPQYEIEASHVLIEVTANSAIQPTMSPRGISQTVLESLAVIPVSIQISMTGRHKQGDARTPPPAHFPLPVRVTVLLNRCPPECRAPNNDGRLGLRCPIVAPPGFQRDPGLDNLLTRSDMGRRLRKLGDFIGLGTAIHPAIYNTTAPLVPAFLSATSYALQPNQARSPTLPRPATLPLAPPTNTPQSRGRPTSSLQNDA
ncbi:hypothetical protein FDECE_1022 [Fusarium decemcellulare]|nr:hypothetical protein FDECE_1022 [Fusarium decemcellulare]